MNSNDLANVMGSFIETELNSFEELNKELEEKDKEIERLNKSLEYAKRIEKDYKTKFDKAIKYLPEIRRTPSYELDEKIDNLESILEGSEKE